ncbi:phage holin family protein [Ravibacter arvi]|uniref:Phage holin family protein n=1 Tax=Ravibacter arvi TaxID=2051041 RepID=A0ABP8MBT7_9BACT
MKLLIRLLIITLGVLVAVNTIDGVDVPGTQQAVVVAVVLGILNAFLKPVLQLLALPVTILTLGLFYFVINVFIVYLTSYIVPSFTVAGFFPALLFSLVVSLVSWILGIFLD